MLGDITRLFIFAKIKNLLKKLHLKYCYKFCFLSQVYSTGDVYTAVVTHVQQQQQQQQWLILCNLAQCPAVHHPG